MATNSAQRLRTPVQFVKGVGPDRAPLLERLKLRTALDLLFCFPRAYQDLSELRAIGELEEHEAISVQGEIREIDSRKTRDERSIVGILISDGTAYLRGIWFNQPFVAKRFREGQRIVMSGTPRRQGLTWEMSHPRVYPVGDEPVQQGEILPVYPLTEGLKQYSMRRIVRSALDEYAGDVEEVLSLSFREQHGLWSIHEALPNIHFPTDHASLEKARRRFIFQELLVLQLALAMRRHQLTHARKAPLLPVDARIDARIRRLFPFHFTGGQELAIRQISADFARGVPMQRLLQGDVGSGKTVVAIYAMLVAVAAGYQALLMAPTEILARQHFDTLQRALAQARVRMALWTGMLTAAQRRDTQAAVETGDIDLVVGTQALVQGELRVPKLALVVIDEQHKFGVLQRAQLRSAGLDPHYLVMTATPIPRTVALTSYGDLETSTLVDHPPGRQVVHTYLVSGDQRPRWWDFFRRQVRAGRQGYVITPRVEESDNAALTSLQESFEALCNGELEAFRLDLVHGGMSSGEKEVAMAKFRQGTTQVLVATSVVEVGIDVPNATVMTIENAERFGLAQLHQLRGRISRGTFPGYLGMFGNPQSDAARRRMIAMTETTDGFRLAQLDFELRGPGDMLGTRQHGLPPLRIAELPRDDELLTRTRAVAQEIVACDPDLSTPEFAALRRRVTARYGRVLELGDVG